MISKQKFLSFSSKKQHKFAAHILREFHETKKQEKWHDYLEIASWLALPPISPLFPAIADRYHYHLKKSFVSIKEYDYLSHQFDRLSRTPYLPIAIYLENLRSAHNVGSIIRTVEAFRLGTLYLSSQTPSHEHPKVQKTSMGTLSLVPIQTCSSLGQLPQPLIALETIKKAPPYYDFDFPATFSLLIGNEEYGLSQKTLFLASYVIQIPLQGSKNSLNVASAFSIIAAHIRQRLAPCHKGVLSI